MENIYWKAEILTGTYPAKTQAFNDIKMRPEIIDLFEKIGNVYFIRVTKRDVIKSLSKTKYESDTIAERIEKYSKDLNKKIDLIYEKNSRLKFDISIEKNQLKIKIPNDDMFY